MFAIVWKYSVPSRHIPDFVEAYGPEGRWALLFRSSPDYLGTDLIRCDEPGAFVTIDRWSSRHAFEAFMHRTQHAYDELDAELDALTGSETLVGHGEIEPGAG